MDRPPATIEPIGPDLGIVVPHGAGWIDLESLRGQAERAGVTRARIALKNSMTMEQAKEARAIRDGKHFLVRNDGSSTGERWRCRRCNRVHTYYTCMCVELPFLGLADALWAYASVRNDAVAKNAITSWAPDVATGHPYSVRQWASPGPTEDIIAIALGVAEPIPAWRARRLAVSINARRPPQPVVV